MSYRINEVHFKNYGIIKEFSSSCFSNINLIIGENDTGKTFLLKALYSAVRSLEETVEGVPELLRENDLSGLEIRLVLVVKNAEKEWLVPFQDVFKSILQDELRIWKIPGFSIINEATARAKHFII